MDTLYRNIDNEIRISDEIVLNHQIDKEVQRIFLPLNLMQIVMLNPKYHIKNNFINTNNWLNKLILIGGAVVFMTTYIYRILEIILDDNFRRYSSIVFLRFASFFDFTFKCVGFIMTFIVNYFKSKKSVLFVLNFQELHRFLYSEASLKRIIIRSWMTVAFIFGFYIIIVSYEYLFFLKPPLNVIIYIVVMVTLDTNLVYAIRLTGLLPDKVELWNVQLLLIRNNGCSKQEIARMFEAYVQILKCYKIVTDVYQLPILYKTVETFCQGLINVQIIIEFCKYELQSEVRENPSISIFLILWLLKNYILQISLSRQFEAFYEAVKSAQDSCEFVLASNCTGDQKKLCKNILRLHRASFRKLSVCGLFYIDVCHPLHLMALLTHYTVVLLQFAFL